MVRNITKWLENNKIVVLIVFAIGLFIFFGNGKDSSESNNLLSMYCLSDGVEVNCVEGFTASTIGGVAGITDIYFTINIQNTGDVVLDNVRINGLTVDGVNHVGFTSSFSGASPFVTIPVGQSRLWTGTTIPSAQFEGQSPNFCVTVDGNYYKNVSNPSVLVSRNKCVSFAVKYECTDNIKNTGSPVFETDVDCGGLVCPVCADGKDCLVDNDCVIGSTCVGNVCVHTPTCSDSIKNQGESDIDCGGPNCGACADGKTCNDGSDCVVGMCYNGFCGLPNRVTFRTNALTEAQMWAPVNNAIRFNTDADADGDLETYTRAGGSVGGGCDGFSATKTPWNDTVCGMTTALGREIQIQNIDDGFGPIPELLFPKTYTVSVPLNLGLVAGYNGAVGFESYSWSGAKCGDSVCQAAYGQGENFNNCPSDCGVLTNAERVVFRTNFNPVAGNYCGGVWAASRPVSGDANVWISVDGDLDGDLDVYARTSSGSNPSCTGVWPVVSSVGPCVGTQVRRETDNIVVVCPGGSSGTGYRFNWMGEGATTCLGCNALRTTGEIDLRSIASYASVPGHECYADGMCS